MARATQQEFWAYIDSNNIKSSTEFRKFRQAGNVDSSIPANPERAYKNDGWMGWKAHFSNMPVKRSVGRPISSGTVSNADETPIPTKRSVGRPRKSSGIVSNEQPPTKRSVGRPRKSSGRPMTPAQNCQPPVLPKQTNEFATYIRKYVQVLSALPQTYHNMIEELVLPLIMEKATPKNLSTPRNHHVNLANTKFVSLTEFIDIAKTMNIKTSSAWFRLSPNQRPRNCPSNPNLYYRNQGWISWKHHFA